jgi:hypothetical protein
MSSSSLLRKSHIAQDHAECRRCSAFETTAHLLLCPAPVDDPLTHCSTQDPPTQGALESKRDPGTWNGTRCEGPPPVDDPLTHCSTQDPPTPRTHPPRVLWNPREIQAPGMGLDVRAHHQWMIHSPTCFLQHMGEGRYAHRCTHGGPPRPHLIVQCSVFLNFLSKNG